MKGKWFLTLGLCLLAAACNEKPAEVAILSAPFADGQEHREPIFYNGRMYEVSYRFDAGSAAYALKVTGERRKVLKPTPANAENARQIAISSLSHFACPTRKRAQLLGAAAHDGEGFTMKARCGG